MKTKDNAYFDRFLQYILANLVAALCYFLLAAILGASGAKPGESILRFLSAAITALPFALTVFLSTRRDKTLPRMSAADYFRGTGRTDLITYGVWSICGAMVAMAGEVAGITVYLFLAQALPTVALAQTLGKGIGLPLATILNIALYAAARLAGVATKPN